MIHDSMLTRFQWCLISFCFTFKDLIKILHDKATLLGLHTTPSYPCTSTKPLTDLEEDSETPL